MLRALAGQAVHSGVTMSMLAVLLEAHLRSLPRKRAVKFVQEVSAVFDAPTPITASREEAAAQARARELWIAALPRIVKLLA